MQSQGTAVAVNFIQKSDIPGGELDAIPPKPFALPNVEFIIYQAGFRRQSVHKLKNVHKVTPSVQVKDHTKAYCIFCFIVGILVLRYIFPLFKR